MNTATTKLGWLDGDLESDILSASQTDARVLISGQGAESRFVAEMIHQWSRRRSKPIVVINGADFDFVHLKSAAGGTLLMQEIENVGVADQKRLCRFIEAAGTAELNVRLMAATGVRLHAQVAAGEFRADVFYRMNVIHLVIPRHASVRVPMPPRAESTPSRAATTAA